MSLAALQSNTPVVLLLYIRKKQQRKERSRPARFAVLRIPAVHYSPRSSRHNKVNKLVSDLLLDERHDADSCENRLPTQALPWNAVREGLCPVSHRLAQVPHKERHIRSGKEGEDTRQVKGKLQM